MKRIFLSVTILGCWAKKHQLFDEIYRVSPSKLFSKCSLQNLDARCVKLKKIIFHYSSWILSKRNPQFCQNYLVDFRSNCLGNDKASEKTVSTNSFGFWAGIFQTAGKKTRLACENCMLHVQIKVLTRNFFLQECFILDLNSEVVQKLFEHSVSLFSGYFSETAYYVSMVMIKLYIHFSDRNL